MVSPDAQHSGVGGALLRDGERLWPDVPHFLTAVSSEWPETDISICICSLFSAALEYYPKQCFQVYRPRLEYNQGEVFVSPSRCNDRSQTLKFPIFCNLVKDATDVQNAKWSCHHCLE